MHCCCRNQSECCWTTLMLQKRQPLTEQPPRPRPLLQPQKRLEVCPFFVIDASFIARLHSTNYVVCVSLHDLFTCGFCVEYLECTVVQSFNIIQLFKRMLHESEARFTPSVSERFLWCCYSLNRLMKEDCQRSLRKWSNTQRDAMCTKHGTYKHFSI